MSHAESVFPLFIILFICVFDGYSMCCSYRFPAKKAWMYFAVVTVLCLAVNSIIVIRYGNFVLKSVMLFTIGLPYFFLILFVTKDKVSQTVFNFWLWINVYSFIANLSELVNDHTLRNMQFLVALQSFLLCGYFVLYNKCLKTSHRRVIEKLEVNWWIFSFIPMTFSVLIWMVKYRFRDSRGTNYPVLMTVFVLMLLVYLLIIYTFRTASSSTENQWITQCMKKQILLQKKQYMYYQKKTEEERIFRHDQRFRNSILQNLLESGDTEGAKEFLRKEQDEMQREPGELICENRLVNAVLTEYRTRAEKHGLDCSMSVQMPETLACDEAEFCVMLSNLLENSLDAAGSYLTVVIKCFNSQLSLKIENDYCGELKKDRDGRYMTNKPQGSGLGLKSVDAILKHNYGFLKTDDKNGVFQVFATLKNETDI